MRDSKSSVTRVADAAVWPAALSLAASLCQEEKMHMKAPTRKSSVATFLHMELYNIKKK
jgi:hypothetical protein